MRPLTRIAFSVFFLFFVALNGFAGTGSVRPVHSFSLQFKQIQELDSVLGSRLFVFAVNENSALSSEESSSAKAKICSCQILNLESSNYDHRYVVLLAEKTNDGSSTAYTIAKNRIQREKKLLKNMFYDKVIVVAEKQGTGSCKSMFYNLRTADKNLQLYEILNAD